MKDFVTTFLDNQEKWVQAFFEHLQLSFLAIIIAITLTLPIAFMLSGRKRLAEGVLQVTGIFQTLPSLALLGLFIPFMGIGVLPAVVTLTIYALFPILQNTLTGLAEIDPALEEAATAFGMTKWEKLITYQLALAMPVILSGIRTAAVMVIGTATLAALVGAGGLGSFILLGIDRQNSSLILIGALSSALLAILVGLLLKGLQKYSLRVIFLSFFGAVVGLLMTFYPFQMGGGESLVIAGKLGAEPAILIHLYEILIEEQTDIEVEVKPNFGKTTFLYEALKSGDIDLYPEYTGTITSSLLAHPPQLSNDAQEVYQAARQGILEQDGLVYLAPSQFQNTYALAVEASYAKAHGLEKISDLEKVAQEAVAGFSLEFSDREDGNKGLRSLYGLELLVKTMEPALRYQALTNQAVQVIDVYSTDSELIRYQLTVLADDKGLFPPYQVAPLLSKETLSRYPELESILGVLAGKISSVEMAQMNYAVDVEGQSPAQVARDYLIKEGLIRK